MSQSVAQMCASDSWCRSVATVRSNPLLAATQNWSFAFGAPNEILAPYVRNFWEVRGDFNFARDRMLPCDQVAVVFNLGAPQSILAPGSSRQLDGTWVCGPQLTPLTTVSPPGTWICGARLTHQGSFLALGVSPRSLVGRIIDLADSGGLSGDCLFDRVRVAETVGDRFDVIGAAIAGATLNRPEWSAPVDFAVKTLRKTRGQQSVQAMADEIGWSRQRLHRSFVDFVGISPKKLARLERFSHALDMIGFEPEVNLANVAHSAGYYDQPHFNREFETFSGLTPGRFLQARTPQAAGFV